MSRISVKDAVKRYGNNTVIPDLNLEIGDGELFTLLGPSGCGKSTLLKILLAGCPATRARSFMTRETCGITRPSSSSRK